MQKNHVTATVNFDNEWAWDNVTVTYNIDEMAINKELLLKNVNNDLKATNAVFKLPEGGCTIKAICKDDRGAYLDMETLYGTYAEANGFIED